MFANDGIKNLMATIDMTSVDADNIIDTALMNAGPNGGKVITGPDPSENATMPGPLPTDDTVDEANLTPEQKKQRADQAKIAKAQNDMLGKEQAEAARREQADQAAREATLIGIAEKALQSGKSKASAAGVKIGNAPTPGSLGVPLAILIVFFFILITYNGNTRFQWLWLVLTNNAYVTPSSQSSSSSSSSSTPPPTGSGNGPTIESTAIVLPLLTFSSGVYEG